MEINCKICGKSMQVHPSDFATYGKKYCSIACKGVGMRKVERPSKETLKKDLSEFSIDAIGRKYGVSGNSIRKWLKINDLTF